MKKLLSKKGMSLSELVVTVSISIFLIAIVLSVWFMLYRNWSADNVRLRNRINLEIVAEKIKDEIRLSSSTYISGYPENSSEYTAISFPQATADANGFFTLEDGFIKWDKSVIYHIYNNPATSNSELRRTVFSDNNAVLSDGTQRQSQLNSVAVNGDGSSAINGNNSTTTVIIPRTSSERANQSVNLSISAKELGFNAYDTETKRVNVSFGSIELAPGDHELRFEVVDKDDDSSGYGFGIDTLSISPSGCEREVEVYKDSSSLLDTLFSSSGESSILVGPNALWKGNYFLEFNGSSVGSYLTIRLYCDLFRESDFLSAQWANTLLTGDKLIVQLPDTEQGSKVAWQAEEQAGANTDDYTSTDLAGKTFRTVLKGTNVVESGNMIRIRFDSASDGPVTISNVYLDLKDDDSSADPTKIKYDPSVAAEISDYNNNHIQLFFTDPVSGAISDSFTIDPTDSSNPIWNAFTNWAIYEIIPSTEYVLTYHIINSTDFDNVSYCQGSTENSYTLDDLAMEYCNPSDPSKYVEWSSGTYDSDNNIYCAGVMEVWVNNGSVTSTIYDTKQPNPNYSSVRWTESEPSQSNISIKVRTSDDENMTGATSWDSVGAFSSSPSTLSVGTGQYLQFRGELSINLVWTCAQHQTVIVTDNDYKQNSDITCSTCGSFLVPLVTVADDPYPWLDNVTIDFPGEDKICQISGNFVKDDDYGIISLSVDGQALNKSLSFALSAKETVLSKEYENSVRFSVQPRNNGK